MGRGKGDAAETRDLEVLDPATGEPFRPVGGAGSTETGPHPPRARRLRGVAVALALLAVVAAGAAGQRAAALTSLQTLNRSWAQAMAVDAARQDADREVQRLRPDVRGEQEPDRRAAMAAIGDEAASRLGRIEDDLRGRRILDHRIDRLRDQMVEALRFRRFQMSAEREVLGSTPLQRVEVALDEQLERFGLEQATASPPVLRSSGPALEALRRFAPTETGTLLVALDGRRLLHVDVDASTVEHRTLPQPALRLLAAGGLLLVSDGRDITAYPTNPRRPPAWTVAGASVIAARPGGDLLAWISTADAILPIAPDGSVGDAAPIPVQPGTSLVADTEAGLLIEDGADLRLHDPTSGRVVRELTSAGRFVGASSTTVVTQAQETKALLLHRVADGAVLDVPLPSTDASSVVASPVNPVEFAFAAGPLAGNTASILRLELKDRGAGQAWSLLGVDGPRATLREGTVAWSPSGEHLFWLTPDGRIAVTAGVEGTFLRAPVDGVEQLVAIPRRR